MRVDAARFFLPEADEAAQAGDVGVYVQAVAVTLGFPYGFGEGFHHLVFGSDPVAVVAGNEGVAEGADAGRLVDGGLLLDGEVQREVEEGVFAAVFGLPLGIEVVLDVVEGGGVFAVGFEDAQGFLLQGVEGEGVEALPPDAGEEAAHVVGVYVVHGLRCVLLV